MASRDVLGHRFCLSLGFVDGGVVVFGGGISVVGCVGCLILVGGDWTSVGFEISQMSRLGFGFSWVGLATFRPTCIWAS